MIFPEGLEALLDMLKQMAPVLVLLSTIAVLWWRSAHLVRTAPLDVVQSALATSLSFALMGYAALFSL